MIMGINGIKSGCDFPLWMQYVLVIYMLSFIVLFGNFYAKAYIEKVRYMILQAFEICGPCGGNYYDYVFWEVRPCSLICPLLPYTMNVRFQ
jgi:elongation of very long chain fatty acids protein 4